MEFATSGVAADLFFPPPSPASGKKKEKKKKKIIHGKFETVLLRTSFELNLYGFSPFESIC
jgi:hypothetical protein